MFHPGSTSPTRSWPLGRSMNVSEPPSGPITSRKASREAGAVPDDTTQYQQTCLFSLHAPCLSTSILYRGYLVSDIRGAVKIFIEIRLVYVSDQWGNYN